MTENSFFTIKARVAHKLVELTESTPNGVVRNTRAELATMVGTRPEEVMKALRQLRDEGFIYYRPHFREILVLQPGWLAMF